MPRQLQVDLGGIVYHVLNRRAGRATPFEKDGDCASLVNVLSEASHQAPVRDKK